MNTQKINANKWTLIEEGVRDTTWAKIKNGKVHVLTWYYDEDGYFSRNVFIGDTYEKAVSQPEVFSHWETFEPYLDEDE